MRGNSIAVSNDTGSLGLAGLDNDSLDVGSVGVVVVGQVHNSSSIRGVAAKEDGMFVETCGKEDIKGGHERHARKACGLGLLVGANDGGARGEEVGCVCAIVGSDDDVDVALGLDQRPERHGRVAFTAIDNLNLGLCVGEGGGGVLVEGVRVGSVEIAGDRAVGVQDNGFKGLHQRLRVVSCSRNIVAVIVE